MKGASGSAAKISSKNRYRTGKSKVPNDICHFHMFYILAEQLLYFDIFG